MISTRWIYYWRTARALWPLLLPLLPYVVFILVDVLWWSRIEEGS